MDTAPMSWRRFILHPLFAVIVSLLVVLAVSLWVLLRRTDGRFVYVLDDPYIHMAMAANLARHGNWGVTPDRIAFASSSPAFTLALAAVYLVFGVHESLPFLINVIVAAALLAQVDALLQRRGVTAGGRIAAGLSVLLFTPLPALVFGGQEHLLHAVLTIALADSAARALSREEVGASWRLAAMAAVLPLIRFEALFLIAVVASLLIFRGQYVLGGTVAAVALSACGLYGAWAVAHGGYFLPNSVLVKATRPELTSLHGWLWALGGRGLQELAHTPVLLILAGLGALVVARELRRGRSWSYLSCFAMTFVATLLLHVQFAEVGWFYRYEAYLVALGITVSFAALPERTRAPQVESLRTIWPVAAVLVMALIAVLAPFVARGAQAFVRIPDAARDIHHQQLQMALFLRDHYRGDTVAANDIGLISYLGEVRCLDLWGLASQEVAGARLLRQYDTATIRRLAGAQGARVAVVYEEWFSPFGGLPPEWTKVATWTLDRRTVVGGAAVSFFAIDPSEAGPLTARLREFAARLPEGVVASEAKAVEAGRAEPD
jgi:hypothetical protein